MMKYKGYTGVFELDDEARIFLGRVVGLRDVITFEARNADELIEEFHISVDVYLEFCAERGESPEKPYSGNVMVRLGPQLHRLVSHAAEAEGSSLNEWIKGRLEVSCGEHETLRALVGDDPPRSSEETRRKPGKTNGHHTKAAKSRKR
jgi:predicted HicB family RNase H-like nuclease